MFFSEEFIHFVEVNPIVGIVDACKQIKTEAQSFSNNEWTEEAHELLWEGASFLDLVIATNDLHIDTVFPEATGEIATNCQILWQYILEIERLFAEHSLKLKVETYKSRYKTAFKATFAYEFSQGDFERIQTLVNELRDQIADNDNLENNHKQRLLKRLESLQSELHKRVSDLDRFWGMVGDAGVVVGKLGADAKPIVDRVKEIAEIVWKTQARTEELPSDSLNPMIGNDKNT
jgi:ribosomal protein S20